MFKNVTWKMCRFYVGMEKKFSINQLVGDSFDVVKCGMSGVKGDRSLQLDIKLIALQDNIWCNHRMDGTGQDI